MRQLGAGLMIAGAVALVVGLMGLLSMLLQSMGVAFVFAVTPWYGPFLGALVLLGVGWFVRRQATTPARSNA